MLNNPRATGLVDLLTVRIFDKTVENLEDLRCGYPSLRADPVSGPSPPFPSLRQLS
jgi:hypothetical protein